MNVSYPQHVFCSDLAAQSQPDAQHLQTAALLHHDGLSALVMSLPSGHTLREHLSPRLLTFQIIAGLGSVTVGRQTHRLRAGAWLWIAPNIPHEIVSDQTLIMLLSLFTLPESTHGFATHDDAN